MYSKTVVFLAFAYAGLAYEAQGAAITVPMGLNPGDKYRIVFVTSTQRDASSTDIADYNMFVTDAANLDSGLAALGTQWTALVSTSAVNALTNSGLSGSDSTTKFFNTNGQLIATGSAQPLFGLYGGPLTAHSSLIFSESGSAISDTDTNFRIVWTGTESFGNTTDPSFCLGCSRPIFGRASLNSFLWTQFSSLLPSAIGGFYGVSTELTVPSAEVPEPGSNILVGLGAMVVVVLRSLGGK